jgi:hypothetical protein
VRRTRIVVEVLRSLVVAAAVLLFAPGVVFAQITPAGGTAAGDDTQPPSAGDLRPPVSASPCRVPGVALDEMNPPLRALNGLRRALAEASLRMDFSEPDEVPEDVLNRVIWHSVKGDTLPYPRIQTASCVPVLHKRAVVGSH